MKIRVDKYRWHVTRDHKRTADYYKGCNLLEAIYNYTTHTSIYPDEIKQ